MTTQAVLAYLANAIELQRRLGLMECRAQNKPIYRQMIGHDLGRAAPSVCAALPELIFLDNEMGADFVDTARANAVVPVAEVLERFKTAVAGTTDGAARQLVLA